MATTTSYVGGDKRTRSEGASGVERVLETAGETAGKVAGAVEYGADAVSDAADNRRLSDGRLKSDILILLWYRWRRVRLGGTGAGVVRSAVTGVGLPAGVMKVIRTKMRRYRNSHQHGWLGRGYTNIGGKGHKNSFGRRTRPERKSSTP